MRLLVLAWCAVSCLAQTIDPVKLEWLKSYAGKSTNTLIWDSRYAKLVDAAVPKVNLYLGMSRTRKPPLSDAVFEVTGGPPEDVAVRDGRYVSFAAARPHSAMERGFIWVDTEKGMVVGAVVHYFFQAQSSAKPMVLIYSRQCSAATLPELFRQELDAWLKRAEFDVESRRFVGRSGVVTELKH